MILATSCTAKSLTWKMLSAGTSRLPIGTSTATTASAIVTPAQPRMPSSRPGGCAAIGAGCAAVGAGCAAIGAGNTALIVRPSRFGAPTLHREQARGLSLDEDDDDDQHEDLRQHRAGNAFEKLVEHAQPEGSQHRAGELADAADDDHQERV